MNTRDRELEEKLQAEAEAAEKASLPPGSNAAVNEYRLVVRALQQPPFMGLPQDFAARVARRVIYAEERGSFEDWVVTGLLLGLAAGAMYYLQPLLAKVVGSFHMQMPNVPWPLLFGAAIAVGAAWLVDQSLAHKK